METMLFDRFFEARLNFSARTHRDGKPLQMKKQQKPLNNGQPTSSHISPKQFNNIIIMKQSPKFILSGGGTGGHIFPALSIASALQARHPDAEILFVGAENRMEMDRVPEAGYQIVGLPVAGFNRKNPLKNFSVLWKLSKSLKMARQIVGDFQPDIAIGVGGYASYPLLKAAAKLGIPTLLLEPNSYAGIANKRLAKHASKICVAYEGMQRFFPKHKLVLTGNPVRPTLNPSPLTPNSQEARAHFGLLPDKKTILVLGGSLGARTINQSIENHLPEIKNSGVQVIWQTGNNYLEADIYRPSLAPHILHTTPFISRMDLAYAAADLVISRAGAGSISELCLLGKPAILVPSPNVAEDHQTKNALALMWKGAAILITDKQAPDNLVPAAISVVQDDPTLSALSRNIQKLALPNAANKIVDEIEKLIQYETN
jgi:UDP-N-acetylglucosamine--N-acetylmuramyl-(pentapeptide) pyrophosphoryl-undecaprenol N-acetylglucosamine transferase